MRAGERRDLSEEDRHCLTCDLDPSCCYAAPECLFFDHVERAMPADEARRLRHAMREKDRYWRDPDAAREYGRRKRWANRDADLARKRRYSEENREKIAEADRRRYAENREAELERNRRYRETHREQIRQRQRERDAAKRRSNVNE